MFDYTENTPVMIDNKIHMVRFYDGMTGIGSRDFWVDDKKYSHGAVRQTENLTRGNHFLYLIKWRDQPWDLVYIFISEEQLPVLLSEENSWREPKKIEVH